MLLALNAVLYLAALSLSLCVVTPVPEGASRRVRVARTALACGGGAAIAGAITLTFLGLWVESAVVGCFALVVVVVCLWVALSQSSSEHDDGEDGSDGGGGRPRADPAGAAGAARRAGRAGARLEGLRRRARRLGARPRSASSARRRLSARPATRRERPPRPRRCAAG